MQYLRKHWQKFMISVKFLIILTCKPAYGWHMLKVLWSPKRSFWPILRTLWCILLCKNLSELVLHTNFNHSRISVSALRSLWQSSWPPCWYLGNPGVSVPSWVVIAPPDKLAGVLMMWCRRDGGLDYMTI